MADKKSILDEALLDIKTIQSALNANTTEILRSVAIDEIDSVVKDSLIKEVYEEEDLDATDNVDDLGGDANAASADIEGGIGGEEGSDGSGLEDIQGSEEVGPVAEPAMDAPMGPEMGMDALASGGEELDLTAATDDEVISVYKKMTGEDEIEIVGDDIHLTVSEPGEYVIKTNDAGSAMDGGMGPEMGGDVDYEIEMGDEMGSEEPADLVPVEDEGGETEGGVAEPEIEGGEEESEEVEEREEQIPVGSAQAHHPQAKALKGVPLGAGADNLRESVQNKKLLAETIRKYNTILTESKKLKAENEEFRKALKEFRNKLVETVVFNSNLTYVTRLFVEHATTKGEKQNIIKRFDEEVSNLKESKKLYKSIVNELETRKPITEAVGNKITKEVSTGSSKQLNESTAYVDPSTKRILDLIQRVEQR